jgi:hypothetical protein
MHAFFISFLTLTVSAVYCFWHTYYLVQRRRQRRLCEGMARMLWVLSQLPEGDEPAAGPCGPDAVERDD